MFLNSGFLCLVIVLLSLFAVNRLLDLRQITGSIVDDALPGIVDASQINIAKTENVLRLYRMLLAKTPEERQKHHQEIDAINAEILLSMTNYEKTISLEDRQDRQNFETLRQKREAFVKTREQFCSLVATNEAEAQAYLITAVRAANQEYTAAADALLDYNKRTAQDRGKTLAAEVASDVRLITIAAILALVIGVVASLGIIRSIVRALSQMAQTLESGSSQVVAAASQISSSSQSLAEGASEQAASLEETSSSLEEISSMTARNAENAEKSKTFAAEARQAADTGTTDMQAMSSAMAGIKDASSEISKIIKTIDEIAFQTNILALNAAVEAARAGEAGMGFAVVAEEVRSLAQRSAQAAKETASKIEGSISRTEEGVVLSAKVAESLQQIVVKVHQVDELVAEVAAASREQSQGLSQVTSAIGQMDSVTQTNAAAAEESASAAEELHAQAGTLNDAVAQLLLLTDATLTSSSGASPSAQERKPSTTTVQIDPLQKRKKPAAAEPFTTFQRRKMAPALTNRQPQAELAALGDFKDM